MQQHHPPSLPKVRKNPVSQIRFVRQIRGDMISVLSQWFATYGDIVHFQIGDDFHGYVLRHPDDAHAVTVTHAAKLHKTQNYKHPTRGLAYFLGNGLLVSDGEFWRRQRRLMQPAFHTQRIAAYGQTMVDYTRQVLDEWDGKRRLDVDHEMMRLTLMIVARTLFDTDASGDAMVVNEAMTIFQRMMNDVDIFPHWLPTPKHLRQRRALREIDAIIYGMIRERRAAQEDRGDLLSMLLMASDDDDTGMTDKQVRDEAVTLFIAGHETTANALNWTWYLLAQNPAVEAKLHAEIDATLKGQPPTLDDLKRLPYTEMVIKEAMRLYPPAWSFGRQTIAPIEVGGYRIPSGCNLSVITYAMHRDPRWWDDPDDFVPERFAPEHEANINKRAYLPFGGGPRICIGNSFAMMEAQLILATIAQRYRLCLPDGVTIEPEALVTLRPKNGLPMILQPRQQA
ncbi:MAG: cytochrome P450 [Chloroflexi bacterium]|nr:MAG: cytochrome P450 [Chloroflexota bacterium]